MRTFLRKAAFGMLGALMVAGASWADSLETLATADQTRGYEAVGRLNFGDRGFCTASLVTSEVVITAAHCLFDKVTGERVAIGEIEFQAGLRFGRAEAYRGIRRVVIHPAYTFESAERLDRIGADLALLELDRPVRNGNVLPFRTHMRVREGETVQVVSYAKDRADAPSREGACEVLARDSDILVLSCSVDFGSSGAPVFVRQGDEMRIVSVISAKATWGDRPVALAAVMEGELERLIREFARTPAFGPVGKTVTPSDVLPTAAD
ncbi:serine protease [Jannaschia sp. W003]|uniref:trypsin-like serine peptidase n=1 Tax=Jannaschia sp. W003 TaxID=2867012 RepID=UPI0021A2C022|nr:trypsin-like serine protease [Jannaschia sp. W003]UWQ22586.1 trypsin-like serine protease [Jannaschia sp. W003]